MVYASLEADYTIFSTIPMRDLLENDIHMGHGLIKCFQPSQAAEHTWHKTEYQDTRRMLIIFISIFMNRW